MPNCRVDALKEVIKSFRKPAQFVVGRANRQRSPEPLAVGYAIRHEGSMFGERGDGCETPSHVNRGNQSGGQEANQEKGYSDASKTVYNAIGAKRGNGDSQHEGFCSLLKRYQRYAHGFAGAQCGKAKAWLGN